MDWNDFGDSGGTVIDFVMRYANLRTVAEALAFLDNQYGKDPSFSFQQQRTAPEPKDDNRQLEFLSARPIQSQAITNYLMRERQIPGGLIRRYLLEILYRNTSNGKNYFAFGMQNESGGYEIRVASSQYNFKSALIARDITVIRGENSNNHTASVFEGMTDFLSLLTLQGRHSLDGDAIIMHSLSSFHRAADFIKSRDYQTIYTYLDNNKAGLDGTAKFQAAFNDRAVPKSHLFAPYTDLNDALRANKASRNMA
jgi:hypothetical protein